MRPGRFTNGRTHRESCTSVISRRRIPHRRWRSRPCRRCLRVPGVTATTTRWKTRRSGWSKIASDERRRAGRLSLSVWTPSAKRQRPRRRVPARKSWTRRPRPSQRARPSTSIRDLRFVRRDRRVRRIMTGINPTTVPWYRPILRQRLETNRFRHGRPRFRRVRRANVDGTVPPRKMKPLFHLKDCSARHARDRSMGQAQRDRPHPPSESGPLLLA